jgi:hypothetical protein
MKILDEILEAIEDIRRKKELESSIAYGHGFYAGIAKVEKIIKEKVCTTHTEENEEENVVPMLQHLKNICNKYADNCKCYNNGEDTSCPMYSVCDDEYGIHFPCNLELKKQAINNNPTYYEFHKE